MIPISDTVQRRHLPWMTWLLVAINAWVFFLMTRLDQRQLGVLVERFALVPAEPRPAAWITHMFLHGGWAHVLGNLWTLCLFGDNVEDRMGPLRFLVFYLLCGLIAAGAHVYMLQGSYVPVLGASGAIAGVMGAFLPMFPRARLVMMIPPFFTWLFKLPAVLYLGVWFYMQIAHGSDSLGDERASGVAWWAHVGGFTAGLFLFGLFVRRDRWRFSDPGYVTEE